MGGWGAQTCPAAPRSHLNQGHGEGRARPQPLSRRLVRQAEVGMDGEAGRASRARLWGACVQGSRQWGAPEAPVPGGGAASLLSDTAGPSAGPAPQWLRSHEASQPRLAALWLFTCKVGEHSCWRPGGWAGLSEVRVTELALGCCDLSWEDCFQK